jgi:hypothetical protein
LAPWLLGRVVDFFTVFLFTVAAASIGLVSNDDLVDQGFVVVTAENGVGGSYVRGGLTLSVQELEFHRLSSLLCFNFDSRRYNDLAVFRAWDRAFDQQQLTVGIDTGDFEVLHSAGDVTEVTGHALTWEHAAWILRHTDGTWNIVRTGVTVGSTARSKVVTLDGTGIAFTDRDTLNVDLLTDFEQGSGNDIASFQFGSFGSVDAELFQQSTGFNTSFSVVTSNSLRYAGSATLTECDLNSGITVSFRSFDLRNTVVRYVQHGDWDRIPVIGEDAHHTNLATEKAKAHFFSNSHLRLGGDMLNY